MTTEPRPSDTPAPVGATGPMPKASDASVASAGLLVHDRLEIGDPAAPFILPDPSGTQWSPLDNDIAGKPLLLLFQAPASGQSAAAFLDDLRPFVAAHDEFRSLGCSLFGLSRTEIAGDILAPESKPMFPLLTDHKGDVFRAYGMDRITGTVAVLLNANMKIAYIAGGAVPPAPGRILELLRQIQRSRPPVPLSAHPPVLLVPGALSGADCGALTQLWHQMDQEHGAVGHSDVDPKCVNFLHEYGRVKQYLIEDPRLQQALDAKLARRLMPEISKAFDTRAPQREIYALSCYDSSDGGMLKPHRDCASQETQHRRFTLSVALNDTFQGGALRFREYGEQTYNLPVGTAIVFSAAILHEVLPITAGRRFALVTHLYGK